jgi:zinc protease
MRLVVLERHDLPIVTALLVSPHGAAEDPEAKLGRADFVADLMTKGTPTRTATQFADAIESLGASIGGDTSRDAATLSMTARSDRLAPALAILADAARNPLFADGELERARSEALDGLAVAMKRPATVAGLVATRAAYGAAPYGKPESGTPKTIAAITRADLQEAYRATWSPTAATLVLTGDVTPEGARALAEKLFGDWKAPASAPPPPVAIAALPAPRAILIDMPGVAQAAVSIVRPTLTRTDPSYYPLLVANTVLGGGYSSRLNIEVRIKRGLAYGASSRVAAGRLPGPLGVATQTKNSSVPEVIGLMRDEMTRLGREEVSAAELAARKAALIGGFGRRDRDDRGAGGRRRRAGDAGRASVRDPALLALDRGGHARAGPHRLQDADRSGAGERHHGRRRCDVPARPEGERHHARGFPSGQAEPRQRNAEITEILPGTGRGTISQKWWRGPTTRQAFALWWAPSVTPSARHLPVPGRIMHMPGPSRAYLRDQCV